MYVCVCVKLFGMANIKNVILNFILSMVSNIVCGKFCSGSESLCLNLKFCVNKCPRKICYNLFQLYRT